MSDVTPLILPTPPKHPKKPKTPHMTITNFNYEGSYVPGFICHIVVKVDLGWSVSRSTPHHPNASWDIYYGMYLAAILDSSRKGGNFLFFWIIRVVNSQLKLYSHVRWNHPWHPNTPETPSKHPPVSEERWLAIHYTKLGRWIHVGRWTSQYQRRDDLHTTTQNLADEPMLAEGPPSTRAEITCIPLHKTWWMNLHWLMDLPIPEEWWLAYHYTKLGRWTYVGWWTPQYQSRDDLHTTTQNLADEPTLTNGPSSTRAEMTCIPLHKTWQMNLLWLNTMAKVWKL